MDNWFKINRSLFDNDIWLLESFSRGQAWIDLIGNANFKDKTFFIRGNEIALQRGQLGWSKLTMAKRWKWSRHKVSNFLVWLEKRGDLVQQKSFLTTIITIVNYDRYQEKGQQTVQQKDSRRTADGTQLKNVKKEKNEKNNSYGLFLEKFNELTKRKFKLLDQKTKRQIDNLLGEYCLADWEVAITNALKDEFLNGENSERKNYLTPEFLSRPVKFEQYLNGVRKPLKTGGKESLNLSMLGLS